MIEPAFTAVFMVIKRLFGMFTITSFHYTNRRPTICYMKVQGNIVTSVHLTGESKGSRKREGQVPDKQFDRRKCCSR
jgi:hypothetical protein